MSIHEVCGMHLCAAKLRMYLAPTRKTEPSGESNGLPYFLFLLSTLNGGQGGPHRNIQGVSWRNQINIQDSYHLTIKVVNHRESWVLHLRAPESQSLIKQWNIKQFVNQHGTRTTHYNCKNLWQVLSWTTRIKAAELAMEVAPAKARQGACQVAIQMADSVHTGEHEQFVPLTETGLLSTKSTVWWLSRLSSLLPIIIYYIIINNIL